MSTDIGAIIIAMPKWLNRFHLLWTSKPIGLSWAEEND
jgi:hypothetical protein